MGRVDKSDQYMSYHRILRQTNCYWKFPFYHLIEVMATNASIMYNWVLMEKGKRKVSESRFCDTLVLEII